MNIRQLTRFRLLVMLAFLLAMVCIPSFAASAAPKNKLVKEDGYIYFYNANGKIVKNKFVTIKKNTYYFDRDGHMLKKAIFNIGSKTYCAKKDGTIAKNKVITHNGKYYYFDKNGLRQTGLITYNGYRYYLLKSGNYVKNAWRKIGKYYYHFNSRGRMDTNTWVKSYYVDGTGKRTNIRAKEPKKEKAYKKISMQNIKQNPELPTGCESVALTMVLKYYGFNIGKTTIASSYLPLSSSGNFVTAFAGNPFSSSGAGIYAPGLTTTANNFLKAKKSSKRAYDISGMSLKNLYRFIDNDRPVIVWNSMYMRTPIAYPYKIQVAGKSWSFYRYEHCVVLCGYNKKTNQVLINDSLSGLVWRNAKSFETIYNTLGKMAVLIQ